MDHNRHRPGHSRNLSESGRHSGCAPGATFVLGPSPGQSSSEIARPGNQPAGPAGLRRLPPAAPDCRKPARAERPAQRVGTASPASQARGGAVVTAAGAPPPRRLRSRRSRSIVIGARQQTRSRAPGSRVPWVRARQRSTAWLEPTPRAGLGREVSNLSLRR